MVVKTNNGTHDSNLATIGFYIGPDAPLADSQTVDVPFMATKAITLTALPPTNYPVAQGSIYASYR